MVCEHENTRHAQQSDDHFSYRDGAPQLGLTPRRHKLDDRGLCVSMRVRSSPTASALAPLPQQREKEKEGGAYNVNSLAGCDPERKGGRVSCPE
jgi:hypothetical protein